MYHKLNLLRKVLFLFSLLVFSITITSCEDDPVAPQEEHLKAIGMVFYSSGIEVARILRGVTTDTLFAPLDNLSDHMDVMFLDEDEKLVDPPTEHQKLNSEVDDPTTVDMWQHPGEEGAFEFHLEGFKIGETSIEFFVMHNDHADFRSGKIPVKVIEK